MRLFQASVWELTVVLRGGENFLPRASTTHVRGVVLVELDGRDAQDAPVAHVDEDGPAVGVAGEPAHAAAHVHAGLEAHGEHHLQRLREPDGQLVGALDAHLEVLERVDELQVVAAGPHDAGRDIRRVEGHGEVRRRVQAGPGADLAACDEVRPAPGAAGQADLRHEVALLEARRERGVPARSSPQEDLEAGEGRRELRLGGGLLRVRLPPSSRVPAAPFACPPTRAPAPLAHRHASSAPPRPVAPERRVLAFRLTE